MKPIFSAGQRAEIGARARTARKALDKTQTEIAALVSCTAPTIVELEKGGSFSERLLRDVAVALGVTEKWLRTGEVERDEIVHRRSPGQSPFGPDYRTHAPGAPIVAEDSTPFRSPHHGNVRIEQRTKPTRKVPVVSWATAGAAQDYHDLANFLDETVEVECSDANAFAVIVEGDSMEPKISAGDRVVVLPNREAQSGDLVIARTRKDHGVYFKKFLRHGARGNKVRLASFNPLYPPLEFELTDFRFIYPVAVQVRYYSRES